jgi:hypothetical protein
LKVDRPPKSELETTSNFVELSITKKMASEVIDLTIEETVDLKEEDDAQELPAKRRKVDIPLCPVCKDHLKDALSLECCHTFCEPCISTWLCIKSSCPVCRTAIKSGGGEGGPIEHVLGAF